jgi:hypothetical protein
MSDDYKKFTHEQIKEMTFKVTTLDGQQRDRVRERLYRLHDQLGGMISRRTLHLELLKMKEAFEISEVDMHNIEAVFYG